ncbi:FAD:protein FMN transferase [Nevskia sp.]|uniref:FAD:protein FMN transferase n=1 Tax=Nevskia sp. TaxID=1929292 RepID=UPI003F705B0A
MAAIQGQAAPYPVRLPTRVHAVSHFLARQTTYRQRFLAMGTEVLMTVAADRRSKAAVEQAMNSARHLLIDFGREAWAWGEGALAQLNRRQAAGQVVNIPPSLHGLFAKAWEIHRSSGGLFEPRVAALVRLWGFDDPARLRSAPPDAGEIAALRAALAVAPDYDGGPQYGPAPQTGWDFGALGKGYIVDRAIDSLRAAGFGDVSIDTGGHVATRGTRDNRPWRTGLRDPFEQGEQAYVLASLQAGDASVVTHGDDQRGFEFEGRRYSHLLDPASGWPVQGMRALTVVHADGALADAAGAALFVAGRERWPALARELGLNRVLALHADGSACATRTLARELSWKRSIALTVVD